MPGHRTVYLACSLDGYIAGPNDELGFLDPPDAQQLEDTFTPFMAGVGAILMGRRTFDVLSGFDVEWPYGTTPLLVLTHRPVESSVPTVRAVAGGIERAVGEAQQVAGERNVYLDGGELVRQALDAHLVDDLIVTVVPQILGHGIPLFTGVKHRRRLTLQSQRSVGAGYVQLEYRVTQ